jgi:hypothetical protein
MKVAEEIYKLLEDRRVTFHESTIIADIVKNYILRRGGDSINNKLLKEL